MKNRQKRIITILYVMAGIFLLIGIYMYLFNITATQGSVHGSKESLYKGFDGRGLIIFSLLLALFPAIINYQLKKKQTGE